jgi:branched-subunit amino acid transport protein AzlD
MIALLLMMTLISASLRLLPFLFFKRKHTEGGFLEKLSTTLPLCISILLVAHLLEKTPFTLYPFGIPELAGLIATVSVQLFSRTLLLSMGAGILIHQLLLHYL